MLSQPIVQNKNRSRTFTTPLKQSSKGLNMDQLMKSIHKVEQDSASDSNSLVVKVQKIVVLSPLILFPVAKWTSTNWKVQRLARKISSISFTACCKTREYFSRRNKEIASFEYRSRKGKTSRGESYWIHQTAEPNSTSRYAIHIDMK